MVPACHGSPASLCEEILRVFAPTSASSITYSSPLRTTWSPFLKSAALATFAVQPAKVPVTATSLSPPFFFTGSFTFGSAPAGTAGLTAIVPAPRFLPVTVYSVPLMFTLSFTSIFERSFNSVLTAATAASDLTVVTSASFPLNRIFFDSQSFPTGIAGEKENALFTGSSMTVYSLLVGTKENMSPFTQPEATAIFLRLPAVTILAVSFLMLSPSAVAPFNVGVILALPSLAAASLVTLTTVYSSLPILITSSLAKSNLVASKSLS